ncbi:MAG: hypothetical protein Q8928_17305 [Bacteroidota bacterium]|nr:hypothetical protein [Bacteroidota bacterium]
MEIYNYPIFINKMHKLFIPLLSFVIFYSCVPVKLSISDFEGQEYVCDLGRMVGRSIIKFEKKTFLYSERDSLFLGEGKWNFSEDKKRLILTGKISNKHQSPVMTINKGLNLELIIKGKCKLVGDSKVFIRKCSPKLGEKF